jgi:acyl carrier protein
MTLPTGWVEAVAGSAPKVAIPVHGHCVKFEKCHGRLHSQRRSLHPNPIPMNKLDSIRRILRDTLQLGDRAQALTESSALLGAIPELDSMAVVSLITMIEDEFGIVVADDEVTAETFETVGSLVRFVAEKTSP